MATASRHLCRSLLRTCSRPVTKKKCSSIPRQRLQLQQSPFRSFSAIPSRRQDARNDNTTPEDDGIDYDNLQMPANPYTVADLDPNERADYEALSKEKQEEYMALKNHVKAILESDEVAQTTEEDAKKIAFDIERTHGNLGFVEERNLHALKDGYWQEEEDDEFSQVPDNDDDFTEDHISSVAESELEVHREVRQYTRIAAWDLPMLLQFTKPFELPDMKTSPLRFRYTTYMGEHHPAAKKVVVQFTTAEIAAASGLSEIQRSKFIKLVGVRYNPDKDLVHMSCEKFENQAQNKRYLGDLVKKLIAESKQGDMFQDIPFDFRHHKPTKVHVFPEEWKLQNREGVQKLEAARAELRLLEGAETAQQPVNGRELVEDYVRLRTTQPITARSM